MGRVNHGRLGPEDNDEVYTRIELQNYNRLLGSELGLRMTHLGQRSIMNNLLMYKLIAKVQGIKVS